MWIFLEDHICVMTCLRQFIYIVLGVICHINLFIFHVKMVNEWNLVLNVNIVIRIKFNRIRDLFKITIELKIYLKISYKVKKLKIKREIGLVIYFVPYMLQNVFIVFLTKLWRYMMFLL
jgi:hypothetical protein